MTSPGSSAVSAGGVEGVVAVGLPRAGEEFRRGGGIGRGQAVEKFGAAFFVDVRVGWPMAAKMARPARRSASARALCMAGWSAAYDAVFAKYGFIVSNDLDEAVTIAAVLTTNPMPRGDRVAVLTVSGGAGIWGADTVSMQGLQVPELSAPIQAEISALLPS